MADSHVGAFLALGGFVLLAVSATMLYFGLRAAARASRARRSWVRITGHVSDSPLNGSFGSTISYPLPDGSTRSFRTPSVKGEVLRTGDQVQLLVNPENPTEAHVQGLARGIAPVLVSVVGGVFAMAALSLVAVGSVLELGSGLAP